MTRDEQIIVDAIQDNELPSAQAAAYRLLLQHVDRFSAMDQVSGAKSTKGEAPCATGNVNFSGPAPESGLDPRIEEISRGHDGVWRAYGRGDRGQMVHLGESANLADLVGVLGANDKIYAMLGELQIENSKLRERVEAKARQISHMFEIGDEADAKHAAQVAALAKERDEARRAHQLQSVRVRQFHCKFGVPIAYVPAFPARDRMDLRVRLIAEEFCEFLAACGCEFTVDITRFAGEQPPGVEISDDIFFKSQKSLDCYTDLVAAADGLADMQYVIWGAALEFGIPLAAVFAEVHRSNMTKTGLPDSGGKITKGDGYEPPQVERILREHGWEG